MNTHGHEGVAKEAGIPLLEDALGSEKQSAAALYLGNWLTDVSQAIDPVAFSGGSKKVRKKLKRLVQLMLNEYLGTIFNEKITKSHRSDLEPYAKDLLKVFSKALDFFVAGQGEERNSKLAQFFRDSFYVVGYFKYVHPSKKGDTSRLSFEAYAKVFGPKNVTKGASGKRAAGDHPGSYTQYYPHEHLDRPELPLHKDPPKFDQRKSFEARSIHRANVRIEPDMYSYLRDNIQMIAGLLAEVDAEFESAFANGRPPKKNDIGWHLTLAKLGHALHQVEDFFAHSNWVELAATRMGPKFLENSTLR